MLIIAHRGLSGYYPENTMASFQAAVNINAKMIELDVTLSLDRIPIVIHDDTLERTTNGFGYVREKKFSDLKKLDAGTWFSPKFKGESIPSLEEVCEFIQREKIDLNIEIKSSARDPLVFSDGIEYKVLELIEKYKITQKIVISSFNWELLDRIRKISQDIKISLLVEDDQANPDEVVSFCQKLNVFSLNISKKYVNGNLYKLARSKKIPVFIFTVNDILEFSVLAKFDIQGLFTNFPDKMQNQI